MTFFCARNRKKGFFRQFLSSRAKDSVWTVSSSVPVSAVTSANAAALRHRRFLVLQLRDAVVSIPPCRRPSFPFLFPMRCTIPQDAPASSGTSCPRGQLARIGANSRILSTQTQSLSRPCASASRPCTRPLTSPRRDGCR